MNGKTEGSGNLRVVSLRISVPKGLMDFLKDLSTFGGQHIAPKEWAERELIGAAQATIDQISDDEFLIGESLRKKYGLEEKADP